MRLGIRRPKHNVSKQAEMPRVYREASFQNLVDKFMLTKLFCFAYRLKARVTAFVE